MDSSISSELFFNEAEFRVLVPNLNAQDNVPPFQDILAAHPRTFTYYDEHLKVYLLSRIPHQIAGSGEEVQQAVSGFFNQLDVHVEASIVDQSQVHHARNASAKWTPGMSGSSAPTSPIANKREINRGPMTAMPSGSSPAETALPFFSHTYSTRSKDPEPVVFEHDHGFCCLHPVTIPIVYVKMRGNQPQLSITFNVSYRPLHSATRTKSEEEEKEDAEYDTDLFETIDLLSGLDEDPVFQMGHGLRQRFVVEKHIRQTSGSLSSTTHTTPQMLTMRRYVRELLPIRPGISVKMRTTNASVADKMVMMSVEFENPLETGCPFVIDKVDVQVSNSVVAMAFGKEVKFPVTLSTTDQIVFLYDVTLLEDGSAKPPAPPQRIFPSRRPPQQPSMPVHHQEDRLQPQRVSIQVYGSPLIDNIPTLPMRSKWNTMLDVTGMRQKREEPDPRFASLLASSTPSFLSRSATSLSSSVSVSPGARSVGSPGNPLSTIDGGKKRAIMTMANGMLKEPGVPGAARRTEMHVVDGIVVSFTVPSSIQVGKIFPLHVFIVNRSKHTRRFQVTIPNRKRHTTADPLQHSKSNLPPLPVEQPPVEPYMDETEFLRQYFENETHEADIICLENNVRLSPLGPSTSQTVDIRFIAAKEKLHTIDLIQLVDQDTGFVTNLRHVLEIFVEPSQPRVTAV